MSTPFTAIDIEEPKTRKYTRLGNMKIRRLPADSGLVGILTRFVERERVSRKLALDQELKVKSLENEIVVLRCNHYFGVSKIAFQIDGDVCFRNKPNITWVNIVVKHPLTRQFYEKLEKRRGFRGASQRGTESTRKKSSGLHWTGVVNVFHRTYSNIPPGCSEIGHEVNVRARVIDILQGTDSFKLYRVVDHSSLPCIPTKVICRISDYVEENDITFDEMHDDIQVGDIVKIVGYPHRSITGNLRIYSSYIEVQKYNKSEGGSAEDAYIPTILPV